MEDVLDGPQAFVGRVVDLELPASPIAAGLAATPEISMSTSVNIAEKGQARGDRSDFRPPTLVRVEGDWSPDDLDSTSWCCARESWVTSLSAFGIGLGGRWASVLLRAVLRTLKWWWYLQSTESLPQLRRHLRFLQCSVSSHSYRPS